MWLWILFCLSRSLGDLLDHLIPLVHLHLIDEFMLPQVLFITSSSKGMACKNIDGLAGKTAANVPGYGKGKLLDTSVQRSWTIFSASHFCLALLTPGLPGCMR